jgi:hypothetical protein
MKEVKYIATDTSGHSSWLQIQRSGFDSRRYLIFREVVGLERGLLSLMSTIEDLTYLLRGLSSHANYTHRATAACRRS